MKEQQSASPPSSANRDGGWVCYPSKKPCDDTKLWTEETETSINWIPRKDTAKLQFGAVVNAMLAGDSDTQINVSAFLVDKNGVKQKTEIVVCLAKNKDGTIDFLGTQATDPPRYIPLVVGTQPQSSGETANIFFKDTVNGGNLFLYNNKSYRESPEGMLLVTPTESRKGQRQLLLRPINLNSSDQTQSATLFAIESMETDINGFYRKTFKVVAVCDNGSAQNPDVMADGQKYNVSGFLRGAEGVSHNHFIQRLKDVTTQNRDTTENILKKTSVGRIQGGEVLLQQDFPDAPFVLWRRYGPLFCDLWAFVSLVTIAQNQATNQMVLTDGSGYLLLYNGTDNIVRPLNIRVPRGELSEQDIRKMLQQSPHIKKVTHLHQIIENDEEREKEESNTAAPSLPQIEPRENQQQSPQNCDASSQLSHEQRVCPDTFEAAHYQQTEPVIVAHQNILYTDPESGAQQYVPCAVISDGRLIPTNQLYAESQHNCAGQDGASCHQQQSMADPPCKNFEAIYQTKQVGETNPEKVCPYNPESVSKIDPRHFMTPNELLETSGSAMLSTLFPGTRFPEECRQMFTSPPNDGGEVAQSVPTLQSNPADNRKEGVQNAAADTQTTYHAQQLGQAPIGWSAQNIFNTIVDTPPLGTFLSGAQSSIQTPQPTTLAAYATRQQQTQYMNAPESRCQQMEDYYRQMGDYYRQMGDYYRQMGDYCRQMGAWYMTSTNPEPLPPLTCQQQVAVSETGNIDDWLAICAQIAALLKKQLTLFDIIQDPLLATLCTPKDVVHCLIQAFAIPGELFVNVIRQTAQPAQVSSSGAQSIPQTPQPTTLAAYATRQQQAQYMNAPESRCQQMEDYYRQMGDYYRQMGAWYMTSTNPEPLPPLTCQQQVAVSETGNIDDWLAICDQIAALLQKQLTLFDIIQNPLLTALCTPKEIVRCLIQVFCIPEALFVNIIGQTPTGSARTPTATPTAATNSNTQNSSASQEKPDSPAKVAPSNSAADNTTPNSKSLTKVLAGAAAAKVIKTVKKIASPTTPTGNNPAPNTAPMPLRTRQAPELTIEELEALPAIDKLPVMNKPDSGQTAQQARTPTAIPTPATNSNTQNSSASQEKPDSPAKVAPSNSAADNTTPNSKSLTKVLAGAAAAKVIKTVKKIASPTTPTGNNPAPNTAPMPLRTRQAPELTIEELEALPAINGLGLQTTSKDHPSPSPTQSNAQSSPSQTAANLQNATIT